MPDLLPIAPALPAGAAPVAGVAPSAPAAGDGTPAEFMAQLAAALKGLKGLATAVKSLPGQPSVAQPAAQPSMDAKVADADHATPDNGKPLTPSDDVTELMASLGLMLVPVQQPLPAHAETGATGSVAPVGAQQTPAALPTLVRQPASERTATDAEAAQQLAATLPNTPISPELARHVAANVSAAEANAPKTTDATGPKTTEPQATAPAADAQRPATQVDAPHAPQQTPSTAAQPAAPAVAPNAQPHLSNDSGAFQQPSGGQDHQQRGAGSKSSSVTEADSVRTDPAAQSMFANAALTTAAPSEVAAPTSPMAMDVAAQIAHQVDLYRLPGNKGVRIQLHPDDLGGVQVTMRYASGGSLELHVSVEHAATGDLVQAGLNHLRDALATHGFEPDRILMSVTAPSAAGQMDFNASSSGNGAYRSDAGMTAFSQDGQSGQQRSQQDDARGARGWNSSSDSPSISDDATRAGSQLSAGTSVIDYRV